MITLLLQLLRLLPFLCGGHRQLALENLALHQQLAVYKRTVPRPKLRTTDRLFFSEAGLSRDKVVGRISALSLFLVCEDDGRACVVLAVRGLSSFSSRCQWRVATRPRMMGDAIGAAAPSGSRLSTSAKKNLALTAPFTSSHS